MTRLDVCRGERGRTPGLPWNFYLAVMSFMHVDGTIIPETLFSNFPTFICALEAL